MEKYFCNFSWEYLKLKKGSVGLVNDQSIEFKEPLKLQHGDILPSYTLQIETYGRLNKDKTNAILICHALSGNHHAAGKYHEDDPKPGWWDYFIGPNCCIDTNCFFVVNSNNLGGCNGSTGPLSTNPRTGKVYGPDFPCVTVLDWVHAQARLADYLGIYCWAAIIGGSLGGMQALQWSISYPERLKATVLIAAAPKLSAQNIAFNEVARQAIMRDPNFENGYYASKNQKPLKGLGLARMVGHITYLSDIAMKHKFDRSLPHEEHDIGTAHFAIEQYLARQGKRFGDNFDANTYILMTRALDYFDPAETDANKSLSEVLKCTKCKFLVLSFQSDWRFPPERSQEIVNALLEARSPVTYACISSDAGHDAFLMPNTIYEKTLNAFLTNLKKF